MREREEFFYQTGNRLSLIHISKRPTDEQVMLIAKAGLIARDWLVLWESGSQMCLVHRGNGKTRRIEI